MYKINVKVTLCLYLCCGFLAACRGAAPVSSAGEVETRVAATFLASTPQTAGAQSAGDTTIPTLLAPAPPVEVLSFGSFAPYAADYCELVRSEFEGVLGVSMAIETTAFSDRVSGGTGTACRIHATGDGNALSMEAFSILDTYVREHGWTWDMSYGAAGPTGLMEGYRKGGTLGLLSVTWQPLTADLCPSNQPIGACELSPQQKITTVNFDIGQMVVYGPLPADQCSGWLTALQPSIPVPVVQETVYFTDLEGNFGAACQVHGAGTGLDFSNIVDAANAIDVVMTAHGWTAGIGADGPTGTMRAYSNQNQTAIASVTWEPSPDANCPNDQPIGACNLTPEQRLYTITVAFAQK
jgi:hypothetical protein